MVDSGEHGLYNRDTRFLRRYSWKFGPELQLLVSNTPQTDLAHTHQGLIAGPEQLIGVSRTLRLSARGLSDELLVSNTSLASQVLELELEFAADFADLFEVRGWHQAERGVQAMQLDAHAMSLNHKSERSE